MCVYITEQCQLGQGRQPCCRPWQFTSAFKFLKFRGKQFQADNLWSCRDLYHHVIYQLHPQAQAVLELARRGRRGLAGGPLPGCQPTGSRCQ